MALLFSSKIFQKKTDSVNVSHLHSGFKRGALLRSQCCHVGCEIRSEMTHQCAIPAITWAGEGGGVKKKREHKKVNYYPNKKGNYLCWPNAQQTNKQKQKRKKRAYVHKVHFVECEA